MTGGSSLVLRRQLVTGDNSTSVFYTDHLSPGLLGDGDNNTATVTGNNSEAAAISGDANTATVTGNDSLAIAGGYFEFDEFGNRVHLTPGGSYNTATMTGNGLTADTGPGHGNTVVVP